MEEIHNPSTHTLLCVHNLNIHAAYLEECSMILHLKSRNKRPNSERTVLLLYNSQSGISLYYLILQLKQEMKESDLLLWVTQLALLQRHLCIIATLRTACKQMSTQYKHYANLSNQCRDKIPLSVEGMKATEKPSNLHRIQRFRNMYNK